jgi:hypothetical protein
MYTIAWEKPTERNTQPERAIQHYVTSARRKYCLAKEFRDGAAT